MKKLTELTDEQAKEILNFVFNNEGYSFSKISFVADDPSQITMGGSRCIGIEFHNGQDNCILGFNNSKVVIWLYQNGFDIIDQLIQNKDVSDDLAAFDHIAFEVFCLSHGEEMFRGNTKKNWTLDYVKKKCSEIYEKYYLKK